jgi:hypothetical protein
MTTSQDINLSMIKTNGRFDLFYWDLLLVSYALLLAVCSAIALKKIPSHPPSSKGGCQVACLDGFATLKSTLLPCFPLWKRGMDLYFN